MASDLAQISAVVVFSVCPGRPPKWTKGPLAIELPRWAREAGWTESERADASARATYFEPALVPVLYGTPTSPARWSSFTEGTLAGATVWGVEALLVPHTSNSRALVAVHVRVGVDEIHLLEKIVRIREGSGSPGLADLRALLPVGWALAPEQWRATCVAFSAVDPEDSRDLAEAEPDESLLNSLWMLASATTFKSFRPSPQDLAEGKRLDFSADWSAYVLRDGVGFRARDKDAPFAALAASLVHSVYLDVVLLVRVQLALTARIGAALSERGLSRGSAADLISLERQMFDFRRQTWWTVTGERGHANALLSACQSAHDLPNRVQSLIADVADAARLAQSISASRIALSLAIVSLVGVPLSAAYAAGALLPYDGWWPLILATVVAIVMATALALFTPLRELLQGWRADGD